MTSVNDVRYLTLGMVYKVFFFQNISLIIFNNFKYDQGSVKTKLKGLNGNGVVKLLKWLNDVSKWHDISDTGHVMKIFFSENIPLIILNNFKYYQLVVLRAQNGNWVVKFLKND